MARFNRELKANHAAQHRAVLAATNVPSKQRPETRHAALPTSCPYTIENLFSQPSLSFARTSKKKDLIFQSWCGSSPPFSSIILVRLLSSHFHADASNVDDAIRYAWGPWSTPGCGKVAERTEVEMCRADDSNEISGCQCGDQRAVKTETRDEACCGTSRFSVWHSAPFHLF